MRLEGLDCAKDSSGRWHTRCEVGTVVELGGTWTKISDRTWRGPLGELMADHTMALMVLRSIF